MKIDFSDNQSLQAVMAKAILDAIGEEARGKLISDAIKYLMAPGEARPGYGEKPRPSPLEQAFRDAVGSFARREVDKMLNADDSFKERMRGILTEAHELAFVTHREKTVGRVADFIARGLAGEEP